MEFKTARQRRRYHTTRKTLARHKRQVNGEDRKSMWAAFDADNEHYPLEGFDDRAWYRAMRADGTAGKLRGNHQGKYSDPYGERWMQTLNRTRRNRVAMRNAMVSYEQEREPLRPGTRPHRKSQRAPNATQLRDKMLALEEELRTLRARRYRTGVLGEYLSDYNDRRARTLELRLLALDEQRARLHTDRAAREARPRPGTFAAWAARQAARDARGEQLYLTLDHPSDTSGLEPHDQALLEGFLKEALHSTGAHEELRDTHARPRLGDTHHDHMMAALAECEAAERPPTPAWAAAQEERTMPNENCLAGIACPTCGQEEHFEIHASATFDVTDEGTGDYQAVEWNGESAIHCSKCGEFGRVKDFHPRESFVLVSDEMGIYLGEAFGLGFWSRLDPAGQTHAVSLTREDAEALQVTHAGQDVRLERVPTYPRSISARELDAFGLRAYTAPLRQNAREQQAA